MDTLINRLRTSSEPSIRWKVRANVLREDPRSPAMVQLQEEIRTSSRVRHLLSEQNEQGEIPHRPYQKWQGAHWVLATLADLGYPSGDPLLFPLREQELHWLLGAEHQLKIQTINGRVRRCASQEGNTLYALLTLGLADERTEELAARLRRWQWDDGGWNCDKHPSACHSSFMESLIPLRGLALHARLTGNPDSARVATEAAEIFLKRHLYKRQQDGAVIDPNFILLHYPCYWHYDILFALKVMAEAGFIGDKRCQKALDLLESKRLPDGGFPAEKTYYRVNVEVSNASLFSWGGVSKRHLNEWVSADALFVLNAAEQAKHPLSLG